MNDSLWNRMMRAARLEISLYEEVEADTTASTQAVMVIILSSVAAGVGSLGYLGLKGLFLNAVMALVGWYIWAYLIYLIGTRWLAEPQTQASPGELLRTIGFASSPGLIRVLDIIPLFGEFIDFIAGIWMLAATVIAVKQALDFESGRRAFGVCIVGWIVYIILTTIMSVITGWSV